MKLINRMNYLLTGGVLALALVALTSLASAEVKQTDKPKLYPLEKCVVSGEKLDEMGKPYVFTYKGQEIKLCCKDCLKKFNADPAKYMKTIADAQVYPLDTCVVSGEKLGEMGKPFVFTYEGQEVKLCCKSCQKDFKKDPAQFLKKIKVAQAEKAKAKK